MQLEYFQLTSAGDRKVNQDYMAHINARDYGLFMVADGLGGHHAGEKASRFFCDGMVKFAKAYHKDIINKANSPTESFAEWVADAINEMKRLFADDDMAEDAHTTCAILYLDEDIVMTGHCGDSRIYRLNPNEIIWRTLDHSLPQLMLNEGMITEMEMSRHPVQNQLTRSINIRKPDKVEIKLYPAMKNNETFVLCTDGFWSNIKQEELLQLADSSTNKERLAKLVRLATYRAAGKCDNLTVYTVRHKRS